MDIVDQMLADKRKERRDALAARAPFVFTDSLLATGIAPDDWAEWQRKPELRALIMETMAERTSVSMKPLRVLPDDGSLENMGEKIRFLRVERGFTQGQLSVLVQISRVLLNQYESGRHLPRLKSLVRLARALDCSTDYLLGLEDINGKPTE